MWCITGMNIYPYMIKKTKEERTSKLAKLRDELAQLRTLPHNDKNRIAVMKMQNRIRVEKYFLNKIIWH